MHRRFEIHKAIWRSNEIVLRHKGRPSKLQSLLLSLPHLSVHVDKLFSSFHHFYSLLFRRTCNFCYKWCSFSKMKFKTLRVYIQFYFSYIHVLYKAILFSFDIWEKCIMKVMANLRRWSHDILLIIFFLPLSLYLSFFLDRDGSPWKDKERLLRVEETLYFQRPRWPRHCQPGSSGENPHYIPRSIH